MYEPETWPIPKFGQFKDVSTTLDAVKTFDSTAGRLHTCDIHTDTSNAAIGAIECVGAGGAL
jgi:hypothetical protein